MLCILNLYSIHTMNLDFILSPTDRRRMHLQIMEQIKIPVTLGDWSQAFNL
jgi:hypothetical protein